MIATIEVVAVMAIGGGFKRLVHISAGKQAL
jgi:hypothetical protein